MEPFKFSVDFNVNVKLQDDVKQLLEKLLSSAPAAPAPAPAPTTTAPAAPAPAPTTTAPAAPAPTTAPAAPAAPAAPTNNELSINDVRKLLAEKVNEHRAEIKDKLTELGAPSVTKLNKSKYQELFDFLNTL